MARSPISIKKRFEILSRDHFACQYCGRPAPTVPLCVDHCIPVAEGGTNDDFNLVTACEECNQGKSAMIISRLEFRSAFRALCDRAISELSPEFIEEVPEVSEFLDDFMGCAFSKVSYWCDPDLKCVSGAIQGLLDAGNGSDYSIFLAMGMPEEDTDSMRLMAALILWCLGPAPALIPAALSGHKFGD